MDSEEEALDDLEFNGSSDEEENEIDEDILDALEEDLAAEEAASEAAAEVGLAGICATLGVLTEALPQESNTDDSDNDSDDDNDDDELPPPLPAPMNEPQVSVQQVVEAIPAPPLGLSPARESPPVDQKPLNSNLLTSPYIIPFILTAVTAPTPPPRKQSLSPAGLRKARLLADLRWPRSFTVEAICAIPHPMPTHCLASSLCMSHLLTGSDDGYIRDYDIFAGVNGKVYLTAPQRHHCGVMEGLMKAAQIRLWWENPVNLAALPSPVDESPLCAPYSLLMHSDALWSLAGTEVSANLN